MGCICSIFSRIFSCISFGINFVFCQPSNRAIYRELQELKQLVNELKNQNQVEIKSKAKDDKAVSKEKYTVSHNKPDSDIEASPLIENEESPGNQEHIKLHI